MSRRSDLAFSIWTEIDRMLCSLGVYSDVHCVAESILTTRKGWALSKSGILWVGHLTIDGVRYSVGSRHSMIDLGQRILIHDRRDDPDTGLDFLVEPKPKRKVLTSVGKPA